MKIEIIPNEQTPKIDGKTDLEKDRQLLQNFMRFARKQTMCIGLASNQCSVDGIRIDKRFFAMLTRDSKGLDLIINPRIILYNGKKISREEGCLTWRGKTLLTKRNLDIKVSYFTSQGKARIENLTGLRAIIFQHEYDHLQGVKEVFKDCDSVER